MKKKIMIGILLLASSLTQAQLPTFQTSSLTHYGISVQGNTYVVHQDTINYDAIAKEDMVNGLCINLNKGESMTIGYQDSFVDDTDNVYRRKITYYCNNGDIYTYYIDTFDEDYIIDGDYIDFFTISPASLEIMDEFRYGLYSYTSHVEIENGK